MGKTQYNLSIPKQRQEELEKFLKENSEALKLIGIESVPALVNVLSRLGQKPLAEIVESVRTGHMRPQPDSQQE